MFYMCLIYFISIFHSDCAYVFLKEYETISLSDDFMVHRQHSIPIREAPVIGVSKGLISVKMRDRIAK